MTVSSEVNRAGPYLGNGSTTVFGFGFNIVSDGHLRVILTTEAGVENELAFPGAYSVQGVGQAGGGSITLIPAPAIGQSVTILRAVPFVQEVDLENQGAYYAETVEAALDLGVMRDQQLAEEISRAVKLPPGMSSDEDLSPGLFSGILRLADSADSIDTVAGSAGNVDIVAENIDAVNQVAANLPSLSAEVVASLLFSDMAQLLSSTRSAPVGSTLGARREGYAFDVVASGGDYITAGGVRLRRVRQDALALQSEEAAAAGPASAKADTLRARWQNTAPLIWSKVDRVKPEWGGARANGTEWAATRAALQAAADFSAREGKVLLLDGNYGIRSTFTLPNNLRIEARSDSYITPRFNAGVGNAAVIVGQGVTADRLAVNILDVAYTGQAIRVNGGAEIGSISCFASASISTGDAALIVTGAHSRIGQIVIENFFTGWIVTEAEDVTIDGDSLKGVRAGARFEFCKNVHLRGGRVEMLTRTVRTLGDLGFMGVGLRGCSVSDRTVYDCGEHSFRLGGGGTYDELVAAGMSSAAAIEKCRNEGFALRDCRAVRPLGCGFKSQPNEVVRNTDISISGLITEDVDNGLGGDANSSAIRLTNTDHVSIVGFQNRTKAQAYSGTRGLSVEGCDHVHAEGMLGTPSQTGLFVTTSIPEGGSRGITDMRYRVRVTGSQGEGIRVNVVDNANQIRRMTIDMEVINSTGAGLVFNARPDGTSPTTASSMVHLKGYLVGNAPNLSAASIYSSVARFRDDTVKI